MTKAQARIITKALDETLRRWNERRLNLDVMAKAAEGAWPMSPSEAARKLKTIEREIATLQGAIEAHQAANGPNPWDEISASPRLAQAPQIRPARLAKTVNGR